MTETEKALRVMARLCAAGADPHLARLEIQTALPQLATVAPDALAGFADGLVAGIPPHLREGRAPGQVDQLVAAAIERNRARTAMPNALSAATELTNPLRG